MWADFLCNCRNEHIYIHIYTLSVCLVFLPASPWLEWLQPQIRKPERVLEVVKCAVLDVKAPEGRTSISPLSHPPTPAPEASPTPP